MIKGTLTSPRLDQDMKLEQAEKLAEQLKVLMKEAEKEHDIYAELLIDEK